MLPLASTTSPPIDVHTTVVRGMPEDGRFPLNDIPTSMVQTTVFPHTHAKRR